MRTAFAALAGLCFAAGGYFMKTSQGVTRLWPTVAFLLLFAAGAILQALAMRDAGMGGVYIAVLGIEAVFALLLSRMLLGERLSAMQLAAVVLVIGGTVLLRLR